MQERPVFLDKQVDHLELASEHEERRKGVQHSDKEFKYLVTRYMWGVI